MSQNPVLKEEMPTDEATDGTIFVPISDGVEVQPRHDPTLQKLESFQQEVDDKNSVIDARFDALEPRTAKLEGTIKKLRAKDASLTSSLNRLKKRAETAESRLNDLEPKNQSLESKAEGLSDKTLALESSATELGSRAGVLEEAQTETRQQVTALEEKADRLGANLRDTDHRFTEEIKTQGIRLDLLEPRHEALARALEDAQTETGQQLTALGEKANRLGVNLRDTDRRLTEKIKEQETRLDLLEPGHEALKQDHGRLTGRTARLETRAERLNKRLKRATVIVGGAIPVLAAVAVGAYFYAPSDETIALKMDKQLTVLESNVASQSQTLKASQSALDHLQKTVAALQVQLDEQAAAPGELKRAYEAVEQEIRSTDSRLVAMDSRLGAELERIKERIFSDEDLSGAPVDLSTLRSESWLKAQNAGRYVIQLAGTYQKRGLAEFIARYQNVLPLGQLSYFKTVYRGRDWYVLLYGDYGRLDQALKAVESLPDVLQKNGPYIRTFGGVQRKLS